MSAHESFVRFNREDFGYIVGFPDGEIQLLGPKAGSILNSSVSKESVAPYLLETLDVKPGFHLATPPLVWIELTRRCNLTCSHCYISGGPPRENELPTADFERLIDEMAEAGVWAVAFTGGEPTLHEGFATLVARARARHILVGIATNGLTLSSELLDQLPRDGVIISVSLDNLHLPGKQATREFKVVTEAIERCQRMGFMTNIMTNTHRDNLNDLPALMSWAEDRGVSVRSVPFSPLGRGKQHKYLENRPDDVEAAAAFWLKECVWEHEYHQKAGLCVGVIFNYGLSLAYMTRRCSSGRYLCYIASDGTMYPCTMCAGEDIFRSGSVRTNRFIDVWRSSWPIRDLSWDNFAKTCEPCPINDPTYYCAARCPALSFARNGTYFGCGASEFEKVSTIYRTGLLERTAVGAGENRPLKLIRPNRTE